MDFDDSPEQAALRTRVRKWLQDNGALAPDPALFPSQEAAAIARRRSWQAALSDAGFAAPTWPEEFGGLNMAPDAQLVVAQELERARVPGVFDFIGVEMVGPTLLTHATDEQCKRYLPPMLRADELWCQLFSEPRGGSDLAGVDTRAALTEDGSWSINGQKVWTTHAQHAAFGLLIARTGAVEARHRGLSIFIVPMDASGVQVRPIRQISGEAEFNEVFLDDVHLPDDHRVGDVDGGWSVAMTMLGFERLSVGSGHHTVSLEQLTNTLVSDSAALNDERTIRLGQVGAELLALRCFTYRLLTRLRPGTLPGPEAGLAKITGVLASFEACELAVDALGPDGLSSDWGGQVSGFPGVRSAGGSEEILRNVIGERVLGLPSELSRPTSTSAPAPRSPASRSVERNLELSDERAALVDATRQALRRSDTIAAARVALDGGAAASVWKLATAAGWAGILLPDAVGGAGAGVPEALLVARECGRVLAAAHLPAHLPATHLLGGAGTDPRLAARLARGEQRAVYVPSAAGVTATTDGTHVFLNGMVTSVPGAVGADVAVLATPGGPVLIEDLDRVATVTPAAAFDPTQALGSLTFDHVHARTIVAPPEEVARATHLQQALLGAESLGAAEQCLDTAREYALNRTAFGRPIGSYQAVKHTVVEMLRNVENTLSLLYYAGWSWSRCPQEFVVTAYALRLLADDALRYAARQAIFIHGAVGTTWEHNLSLYYRRAELSRRLAGGTDGAARAVGGALAGQAIARRASPTGAATREGCFR